MLAHCDPSTTHGIRDRALLLLGFACALRRSEIVALTMADLEEAPDGRELLLTRYTQPEPELRLLIHQLKLELPPQPPPRITTSTVPKHPL